MPACLWSTPLPIINTQAVPACGKETYMTQANSTEKTIFVDGELYHLPLDTLQTDANQPRKFFDIDALTELALSIEQHGVLEPVLFRTDKNGQPLLISGERRLRAAKLAKRETIPAIYNGTGNPAAIALVENLLRENLNPIEEAEAMQRMIDEFNYTQQQLADMLGKGRSTITEILSLNKLPPEVRDECRHDAKIPRRALVEIAKQKKTAKGMATLFRDFKTRGLTSDSVRSITRKKRGPVADSLINDVEALAGRLRKMTGNDELEAEEMTRLKQSFALLRGVMDAF